MDSDALLQENRNDVAQSRSQMHELVQGMNRLSQDIRTPDADIKGEKKGEKGKGKQTAYSSGSRSRNQPPSRRTEQQHQ